MKQIWSNFKEKHPELAKWLYQIFYFIVFSEGVTIFQYLIFTFMPKMLGVGLAGTEFMWPQIDMHIFGLEFTRIQCCKKCSRCSSNRWWIRILY